MGDILCHIGGDTLRIYVAGRYSAPTHEEREANTLRAIQVGVGLMIKGHHPYIPHLTHHVDLAAKDMDISFTWDDYMRLDKMWLRQCDAILYLGASRGADMELAWATEWGLTIYRSLAEVPMGGVVDVEVPPIGGLF